MNPAAADDAAAERDRRQHRSEFINDCMRYSSDGRDRRVCDSEAGGHATGRHRCRRCREPLRCRRLG